VTLLAQTERLERELDALWLGDLGCASDRRRLVFNDRQLAVREDLDAVAAAGYAERQRLDGNGPQAW
jgi:hypothetical protein